MSTINIDTGNAKVEGERLVIDLTPELRKQLGIGVMNLADLVPGDVFRFLNTPTEDWIVCEQDNTEHTTAIVKKTVFELPSGIVKTPFTDCDWEYSGRPEKLRAALNPDYEQLPLSYQFVRNHDVCLESMDGFNKDLKVSKEISELTFDRYRSYHQFIGDCDTRYALATPITYFNCKSIDQVLYVDIDGRVKMGSRREEYAFRPFCVVAASTQVMKMNIKTEEN